MNNKRFRMLAVAAALAGTALPWNGLTASADAPTPDLAQLNQQLNMDQAKLNDLNDQVERAQGSLDALSRKLTEDRQREAQLDKDLVTMARVEYEQPTFSLSTVLAASSLEQLLTDLAQARLVAHRQRNVLDQAHKLHRQDQQAHDEIASDLARVQAARDAAAQVASRTQSLRDSAQDASVRARAGLLAAQARATQTAAPMAQVVGHGTAGSATVPNRFAFGYCTYYVATRRYVPWLGNAIEWWANARAYNFPEGQVPQVGAIMVTRESGYGHVAYVEAVYPDGSWMVSEMNYVAWDVVDRRTLHFGQAPVVGFIYG